MRGSGWWRSLARRLRGRSRAEALRRAYRPGASVERRELSPESAESFGLNKLCGRSFDCASRDGAARGAAQDDSVLLRRSLAFGVIGRYNMVEIYGARLVLDGLRGSGAVEEGVVDVGPEFLDDEG
jgi:hypothetical protein